MESTTVFRFAADIILAIHVSFVVFVVMCLVLIFVGKARRWVWVHHFWLRVAHLLAIGFVVVQSWFGAICPLTTLEMALRAKAGDATYRGAFIAHWLEQFLYYQAPMWMFAVGYTLFGALVVGSWYWVPPRRSNATTHVA